MTFFSFPNPPPVFPVLRPGFSSHWKPQFASKVETSVSGLEARSAVQAFATWDFELTFEILTDRTQNSVPATYYSVNELSPIVGLFLVCRGQYGRFYYSCPWDNSRLGQGIGIGDGVTTVFRFQRTIGTGALSFTEYVGGVDRTHSTVVYLNGTPQTEFIDWTISTDNLSVVFTSPPGNGVLITTDFYFFYLCRFLEDIGDFENFLHLLWTLKSLKFRSVKP